MVKKKKVASSFCYKTNISLQKRERNNIEGKKLQNRKLNITRWFSTLVSIQQFTTTVTHIPLSSNRKCKNIQKRIYKKLPHVTPKSVINLPEVVNNSSVLTGPETRLLWRRSWIFRSLRKWVVVYIAMNVNLVSLLAGRIIVVFLCTCTSYWIDMYIHLSKSTLLN